MPKSPTAEIAEQYGDLLELLVDAIVPSDESPAASELGGLRFLDRVLTEKPQWLARVTAVLREVSVAGDRLFGRAFGELNARERFLVIDALAGDGEYSWFAQLVNGGFYADPANGGNDGGGSWPSVGWAGRAGRGWPPTGTHTPRARVVVDPGTVAHRYDAIVIGSGAGGGVAACGLAESGRSVLVIEGGSWPRTAELAVDHLHNPRAFFGLESLAGPSAQGNPRVLGDTRPALVLDPTDLRWSNNSMTAGGGTRVYGAQAWRFGPSDFAMASRYGVPEGSALADWPFGYDELEPYYQRAEWEIGVSGDSSDGRHAGHRARPRPMPPVAAGRARDVLRGGADALGISTLAVPLLINSTPWLGRPACVGCAMCPGFACPVDAKNGSQNTMLERAFATGRCSILLETRVDRLITDGFGRVVAVSVAGIVDHRAWRMQISANEFVVAAGAIESARLLLNSPSDGEPQGLGNNADQVGRHLQGHITLGALGVFDETVEEMIGPGPSIATGDFRHENDGIVGGGIIVNEFVMTPSNAYRTLVEGGLIRMHGLESKRGMRELSRRMIRLYAPIQEVTRAESRVRVDPAVTDRFGTPVARLTGDPHPEDVRARDFLADRAEEWLRASGASTVASLSRAAPSGPSGGHHQAGTCRMGTDPASSVTDPWGRVWGHDNLRITDGSLHVTNGGVNPVLTIFANAMRIVENMAGGWGEHAIDTPDTVP